jgi:hypothetical protein
MLLGGRDEEVTVATPFLYFSQRRDFVSAVFEAAIFRELTDLRAIYPHFLCKKKINES